MFNFKNLIDGLTTALNYGNPGVNENTGEVLAPSNSAFLQLKDAAGNLRRRTSRVHRVRYSLACA